MTRQQLIDMYHTSKVVDIAKHLDISVPSFYKLIKKLGVEQKQVTCVGKVDQLIKSIN